MGEMISKCKWIFAKLAVALIGLGASQAIFADDSHSVMNIPDPVRMMWMFSQNYHAIRLCVTAFAFLCGLMLIVKSVHSLRAYGQVRTMMPSHAEFTGPMLQLCIGVALIFLPTTIHITVATFWGCANPLRWDQSASVATSLGRDIGGLIQILGLIALTRGLIIMARATQKGSQPGQFSKGLTHTIGGVLAINYWGLVTTVKASFGLI